MAIIRPPRTTTARTPKKATPITQARGDTFVQTVLHITVEQLAELGFEALSIPQIALLANVNKTSIYRRWPSKEDLVRDALQLVVTHADHVPDTGTLRGDLVALARTVAAFTQSRLGTAVIRIMLAEGGNPEMRALANMTYQESGRSGPFEVMARAMQRGELKNGVDPSLLLFTIAGAIMHRVFVEQRRATDAFINQLVDMVLNGASASMP
jgi:AcrR family transcriptional regulator